MSSIDSQCAIVLMLRLMLTPKCARHAVEFNVSRVNQPSCVAPHWSYLRMQIACVRAQSVHVRCNKLFTSQTAADYGRIMCTSLVGAIRATRHPGVSVGRRVFIRVHFGQLFRVSAGCQPSKTSTHPATPITALLRLSLCLFAHGISPHYRHNVNTIGCSPSKHKHIKIMGSCSELIRAFRCGSVHNSMDTTLYPRAARAAAPASAGLAFVRFTMRNKNMPKTLFQSNVNLLCSGICRHTEHMCDD